jgi:hypothetical protein
VFHAAILVMAVMRVKAEGVPEESSAGAFLSYHPRIKNAKRIATVKPAAELQ